MLWTTTFLRMDGGHLLFALPPIMALLGKLFSRKSPRGAIKISLLALILWGWPFFLYAPPTTDYWKALGHKTKSWANWHQFSGILEYPALNEMYNALGSWIQAHPMDLILFPLHGYDAYRVGQPRLLPVDDLFWAADPKRQEQLLQLIQKFEAPYICLNSNFYFDVYMHDDVDALFDFIATHYTPIQVFYSSILYARRPEPRVLAEKLQSLPGPVVLSSTNHFQIRWTLSPGFTGGYFELNESFVYSNRFFQHFSRPLIKISLNDVPINYALPIGRIRIRNTPDGGSYRIFVPSDTQKVTMKIFFPGLINLLPDTVTLRDIGLYQFNFPPGVPYTPSFLKNGY